MERTQPSLSESQYLELIQDYIQSPDFANLVRDGFMACSPTAPSIPSTSPEAHLPFRRQSDRSQRPAVSISSQCAAYDSAVQAALSLEAMPPNVSSQIPLSLFLALRQAASTFANSAYVPETVEHPEQLQLPLLACYVQTELKNSVLAERVKRLEIDPKTGLFTYPAAQLHIQAATALNPERPCVVLLMDGDHFKRVNTQFGHPAGDQVLGALGRRVLASVRLHSDVEQGPLAGDLPVRYGGEEFIFILNTGDVQVGFDVAERIRNAVSADAIPVQDLKGKERTVAQTVSIGVAPGSLRELPALLKQADRALYQAKEGGRNRTVVYDPTSSHKPSVSYAFSKTLSRWYARLAAQQL